MFLVHQTARCYQGCAKPRRNLLLCMTRFLHRSPPPTVTLAKID